MNFEHLTNIIRRMSTPELDHEQIAIDLMLSSHLKGEPITKLGIKHKIQDEQKKESIRKQAEVEFAKAGRESNYILQYDVRFAMSCLTDIEKQAITLLFFNNLTPSSAANFLGMPLDSFRTMVESSLMKMRNKLEEF